MRNMDNTKKYHQKYLKTHPEKDKMYNPPKPKLQPYEVDVEPEFQRMKPQNFEIREKPPESSQQPFQIPQKQQPQQKQ